jgi:hypothetical protein
MANGEAGAAVDSQGRPTRDPTENVRALTEAAVQRLDDLASLRAEYDKRLVDQRNRFNASIDKQRVRYERELRESDKELRKAESDRIDAIRAVDVGAVQRAAEVSAAQAEALRNTVAAAAAAAATALGAALDPIQKDIADLRRAQYEAQGQKAQVVEARGVTTGVIALITLAGFLVMVAVTIAGFAITGGGP